MPDLCSRWSDVSLVYFWYICAATQHQRPILFAAPEHGQAFELVIFSPRAAWCYRVRSQTGCQYQGCTSEEIRQLHPIFPGVPRGTAFPVGRDGRARGNPWGAHRCVSVSSRPGLTVYFTPLPNMSQYQGARRHNACMICGHLASDARPQDGPVAALSVAGTPLHFSCLAAARSDGFGSRVSSSSRTQPRLPKSLLGSMQKP